MEPNTLIVVALLVGLIVASFIGIILNRGRSAKVEELERTVEATLKHSKHRAALSTSKSYSVQRDWGV